LRRFLDLVEGLASGTVDEPIAALLERVVAATGFEAYLEKAYPGMGAERMENVQSLISAAVEYAEESADATLEGFLDRSALVSDADAVGREPGVTLMTVHCAKGLEFPVVFLSGLEENLFPHAMSAGSDDDLEEERRLCYVAMTRARQRLVLTHARFRRLQGVLMPNRASRFIEEVPADVIDEVSPPAGVILGERTSWAVDDWAGHASSAARAARRRREPPAPARPTRAASAEPNEDGYDIGAQVTHPRFGGGRILDRQGAGKNLKLTIHFADHGRKKILPAYTRLDVG
jgi:DNA helicase-2/ATP-dependent DNA helicase PcrA